MPYIVIVNKNLDKSPDTLGIIQEPQFLLSEPIDDRSLAEERAKKWAFTKIVPFYQDKESIYSK